MLFHYCCIFGGNGPYGRPYQAIACESMGTRLSVFTTICANFTSNNFAPKYIKILDSSRPNSNNPNNDNIFYIYILSLYNINIYGNKFLFRLAHNRGKIPNSPPP